MTYDVAIIGGGPGGTRAALSAAATGRSVALINAGLLGGTCLNYGCIPTKMLLGATAAKPLLDIQQKLKNIRADVTLDVDFTALQTRKNRYIKGTRQALEKQLRQAGVTLFQGYARCLDAHTLAITASPKASPENDGAHETTEQITFEHLIVALGSQSASFPGIQADGRAILDSTQLLDIETPPASLIVVGAGAIGLEMADFFSRLGTKITLVERCAHLAPSEDSEVGETLRKTYSKEGWRIITGKSVASLQTVDEAALLTFTDGETLCAEKALLAAGRHPQHHAVGLEAVGASTAPSGWIATDNTLKAAPHVYAIGDCNGRTLLAHAAEHQARYVVNHLAGVLSSPYTPPPMPACIYGHLEVMRVGKTLADIQQHEKAFISKSQLIANPIAQSYGTTTGWIKILWVDNVAVGITAIGHGVSHLVTVAEMIIESQWNRITHKDIIFAHPSLDEALEAALHADLKPLFA